MNSSSNGRGLPTSANGSPKWKVEKALSDAAGDRIQESFGTFGSMLDAWCRRVSAELQWRFNSYADAQRAQLARRSEGGGSVEDASSIRAALNNLGSPLDVGASEADFVPLGPWYCSRKARSLSIHERAAQLRGCDANPQNNGQFLLIKDKIRNTCYRLWPSRRRINVTESRQAPN